LSLASGALATFLAACGTSGGPGGSDESLSSSTSSSISSGGSASGSTGESSATTAASSARGSSGSGDASAPDRDSSTAGSDASGSDADASVAEDSGENELTEGGPGDSGGTTDAGDGGASGPAAAGVHAVGNQLYDGAKAIRLLGVDESGTQYECSNGAGIFDPADNSGPNSTVSIAAMVSWGINAVRIPLNEDCWLGLNGVSAAYSGTNYQNAIRSYVTALLNSNIYPIVDLHFTEGSGGTLANQQQPMPDAAHGADFWTSVANTFKSQNKVIFDLFNEPYPDSNADATSAWQCWAATTTSSCPGVAYTVIGMQGMLNAVRATGATNFVMMGGIEYSNDLSQWLTYEPTDPAKNVGASWHVYTNSNYISNHTLAADATPVLAKVPIVAGEIGDTNVPPACNGTFITTVMDFLDNPGNGIPPQSYLAWSWSTDNSPKILSSYNPVTPTCDGPYYKAHVMAQQ
jgi:hypothetical protein